MICAGVLVFWRAGVLGCWSAGGVERSRGRGVERSRGRRSAGVKKGEAIKPLPGCYSLYQLRA